MEGSLISEITLDFSPAQDRCERLNTTPHTSPPSTPHTEELKRISRVAPGGTCSRSASAVVFFTNLHLKTCQKVPEKAAMQTCADYASFGVEFDCVQLILSG